MSRLLQGGVVGLHPSEEAAIRKAMRASLQAQKNSITNGTPLSSTESPLAVPDQCEITPPKSDFVPISLKSSNYPLKTLPESVHHHCLVDNSPVSNELETLTPHSATICMGKKEHSKSKGHKGIFPPVLL